MRVHLLSRVDQLERTIPQKRATRYLDPISKLVVCSVAVLFGELRLDEAIMEGFARALGYSRAAEVRAAIKTSDPEFMTRHKAALGRLYYRFHFDPVAGTNEEVMQFADQL